MDAAEVLDRVLKDHQTLRTMASCVDVLARRVLEGEYNAAKRLREQMSALDRFFRQHLELEERIPQIRPRQCGGYHRPIRLAIEGQPADLANNAIK